MKRHNTSFTMVEMIVAMAVLAILTTLLFTVLNETSRAISMTTGRTAIYNDMRIVTDQMTREFQEAVHDYRYNCFHGYSNHVNFAATIDNDSGDEEAEVAYNYDNANYRVTKTIQFAKIDGTNNNNWNLATARTNNTAWQNTPATNTYVTVLEGVRSCQWVFMNTNGAISTPWVFITKASNLPQYIETRIGLCNPQDIIRYKGAANVPASQIRYFTNIVYLPRQG